MPRKVEEYEAALQHNEDTIAKLEDQLRNYEGGQQRAELQRVLQLHERYLVLLEQLVTTLVDRG